jgi:hypothetical protein
LLLVGNIDVLGIFPIFPFERRGTGGFFPKKEQIAPKGNVLFPIAGSSRKKPALTSRKNWRCDMKKRLAGIVLTGFLLFFTAEGAFAQQAAPAKVIKWRFQSHWPSATSFKPLKVF